MRFPDAAADEFTEEVLLAFREGLARLGGSGVEESDVTVTGVEAEGADTVMVNSETATEGVLGAVAFAEALKCCAGSALNVPGAPQLFQTVQLVYIGYNQTGAGQEAQEVVVRLREAGQAAASPSDDSEDAASSPVLWGGIAGIVVAIAATAGLWHAWLYFTAKKNPAVAQGKAAAAAVVPAPALPAP